MEYPCFFCHIRSFEKLLSEHPIKETEKAGLIKEFLSWFSKADLTSNSPEVTREIHSKMRAVLNDPDPYRQAKKSCNDLMLAHYSKLKEQINQSADPYTTALKLAIAGNIMDYAASPDFSIEETINYVLKSDFAIDHSMQLKEDLDKAETVLYLGDNAGEIVMDKLFLETMGYKNIHFAVRGAPIINDATVEDAHYIGLHHHARILSNGYDAPSTLVDKASEEFLEVYRKADFIISKGQGNLEGLIGNTQKSIYFLLMVKCNLIGRHLGVKKGDFVVYHNGN